MGAKKQMGSAKEVSPEHSYAYRLGYAATMNNQKLGFSLLDLVDKQKTREDVLKVVTEYSRGQDHAIDMRRKQFSKMNQEKTKEGQEPKR